MEQHNVPQKKRRICIKSPQNISYRLHTWPSYGKRATKKMSYMRIANLDQTHNSHM